MKLKKQLVFIEDDVLVEQSNDFIDTLFNNPYYFPIVISPYPFHRVKKLIDRPIKSFICLYGQQIIIDNVIIRSETLPQDKIRELIQFCTYTKHPIALYTETDIKINQINSSVEKYQTNNSPQELMKVKSFCCSEKIFAVRIFNQELKKDILYETFFHELFSFKRTDPYSAILGTVDFTEEDAIIQVKKLLRKMIHEKSFVIVKSAKERYSYKQVDYKVTIECFKQ